MELESSDEHNCTVILLEFSVCLREQSLGTLQCQEELALSPPLCVTTCLMQPSPTSFKEWLVFAFSLLAEPELFTLWQISLALFQSALSSCRVQLPAPITSNSKVLNTS